MNTHASRRSFLQDISLGTLGIAAAGEMLCASVGIAGEETAERSKPVWKPVSDRKIRVGIVGHGRCKFGAEFGFQDHPNVEVAAVSDLIPERRAGLAKACRCEKTYPSLEEMVKDDTIEAIYVATDGPSHARHCIEALKHGKHAVTAVPAVYGSLEDAEKLYETVKATGLKYMMFETTVFHGDCHAMREIYQAGGFGKLVYSEGDYYHYMPRPLPSFREWRVGMPPLWYPTHSTGYYVGVTGGSFTEVSCMGMPSIIEHLRAENNSYANPFGTEIALLRTSEGGMSRMTCSWDTPGHLGEKGRVRGQLGSMTGMQYVGKMKNLPNLDRPALPPGVRPGGHDGSHGPLMNEFVTAILEDRRPMVDVVQALNMTVPGIIAHRSAMKDGELIKIPQFA